MSRVEKARLGRVEKGWSSGQLMLATGLLAALGAWLLIDREEAVLESSAQATASGQSSAPSFSTPPGLTLPPTSAGRMAGPLSNSAQAELAQAKRLQELRVARAQDALRTYQQASRYPFDSRPITEHPDQVRPFEPIEREAPARSPDGKPLEGLQLRLSQDRVFLSGDEQVIFQVSAVNAQGQSVPVLVNRAWALDLPSSPQAVAHAPVALDFNDGGRQPDQRAGDGQWAGQFQPSSQGFSGFEGTLRIALELNLNGQLGSAGFDVIYDPMVPARWTGKARDELREGGLEFILPAYMKQAGRYLVSARVYDANNRPIALLNFNQELAAGAQDIRLTLFGKLVRDLAPPFPLSFRDVQGFLLRERHPDRAMMPRWPGQVHVSGSYGLGSFSAAEWQSEERDRYLAELEKDVARARDPGGQ